MQGDMITVLKISSTMNLIEEYQNKQIGTKSVKELVKQQDELIKKITEENKKVSK